MKVVICIAFIFLPDFLPAQITRQDWEGDMERRQRIFDKYEPSHEAARCLLPGLLGVAAGSINTEHTRGKISQQAIMFGAAISIGAWGERPAKLRFLEGLCFICGFALGAAINHRGK